LKTIRSHERAGGREGDRERNVGEAEIIVKISTRER
jgi:hypothetical protein